MQIKPLLKAFVDPLVFVAMTSTVALITGVLAYAIPYPTYLTIGFCILVGVLGSLTVFYQVRRLYRHDVAHKILSALVAEGKQLTQATTFLSPAEHTIKLQEWCERVESNLRRYLDEAHVLRFQLEGNDLENSESMSKWKMNRRLDVLVEFLREPV